jgi:hypothetical protein
MPTWRKSSYTSTEGGNCVELAHDQPAMLIRDSKDPHGPVLTITQWESFLLHVQRA